MFSTDIFFITSPHMQRGEKDWQLQNASKDGTFEHDGMLLGFVFSFVCYLVNSVAEFVKGIHA
jgi:hypothetical protein